MGFRGLTVQGSNGSYPYLSTSERVELVEMVREIIDEIQASKIDANDQSDPLLLMAGAGAESTLETQVRYKVYLKCHQETSLYLTLKLSVCVTQWH